MKRALAVFALVVIAAAAAGPGCQAAPQSRPLSAELQKAVAATDYAAVRIKPFPFASEAWTFRRFTFVETLDKLKELEEMKEDGRWDLLSKKVQSKQEKVDRKLQKNLGGLKTMAGLPGAIFIIDSSKETIAIAEARKMHIPIVAVVDTNGNPEDIDYPIPGNDDAVRAIELFVSKVAESIVEGKKNRISKELLEQKRGEAQPAAEAGAPDAEEESEDKKAA